MKKFFAVLAIAEIFIFIIWMITFVITHINDTPDSIQGNPWIIIDAAHVWLQIPLIAGCYALVLYYFKNKVKHQQLFFAAVTYVAVFCLLVTFLAGSLIGTWAYVKPVPHLITAIVTSLIAVAAYAPKIYQSLTK